MTNKIKQSTYNTVIEALQEMIQIWEDQLHRHQTSNNIQRWLKEDDKLAEELRQREVNYRAQIQKYKEALEDFK